MPEYKVHVDQLREGVFIRLESTGWFDHPFLFSSFKITKPEQIAILKKLSITEVVCIPEKSDVFPLSLNKSSLPPQPPAHQEDLEMKKLMEVKRERIQRLTKRREQNERCERSFQKSVSAVKNVMRDIEAGSQEAFEESDQLMKSLVESLMPEKESAVQLMNTKFGKENVFFHSLNVSVLSMMLGREYGLDAEQMRVLGLGALFHDIGKSRIPKSILHKETPLTRAEWTFYQIHPKYGVEILSKIQRFPPEALQAVYQHHEQNDGQGFPLKLDSEKISLYAKIISIVNVYDNHCNARDPQHSMSPHGALAYMFRSEKSMFDADLLAMFIQCLGVYPPGTIVQLSNGIIGMVLSVNPRDPLHPSLIIYNAEIPKKEALIFDMTEEPNFRIEHSIMPSQLAPEIHDYLSPRTHVTYYVAEGEQKPDPNMRRTG